MKTRNSLGELLKRRRHDLDLTQRELADKLRVRASHIAYLESGKRKPSLNLMARLAATLDVSRQQLFVLAHPEAASMINQSAPALQRPVDAWRQSPVIDREFLKRHKVTGREMRAFKQLSLLGYVLSRHQFLAVLTMIREPRD